MTQHIILQRSPQGLEVLLYITPRLAQIFCPAFRGQSSLPLTEQHFSLSDTGIPQEYKNYPKRWNCMATCANRDGIWCGIKKICGLKLNWETYLIVLRQDPYFRSKYRNHMFPHISTVFSHCYYCKRLLLEIDVAKLRSEKNVVCLMKQIPHQTHFLTQLHIQALEKTTQGGRGFKYRLCRCSSGTIPLCLTLTM